MMKRYSELFKKQMVKKLLATPGLSATALSTEIGVGHSTLSRWVQESGMDSSMGKSKLESKRSNTVSAGGRRPQDWSASERLEAVLEAAQYSDEALGAYLRTRGLHSANLTQWRQDMLAAQQNVKPQRERVKQQQKRISTLEREIRRKDKALAETAALLVLKKKVQDIWGEEDDEQAPGSGK